MEQKKTDFCEIVQKINADKILLPDFQRKFVWTDEEKQRKLIASVLAKMPVGSILLLKSSADEFASKQIGKKANTEIDASKHEVIEFLLDGQQRMTVLSNVFSNVIFEGTDSPKELVSQALKRRFFLKLPKRKLLLEDKCKDLFGMKLIKFPYNNPAKDEPNFLTQDVLSFIDSIDFNKPDMVAYNPYYTSNTTDIDNYCLSADDEHYLIPLYLLIESTATCNKNTLIFKRIMKKVAEDMRDAILAEYDNLAEEQLVNYVKSILAEEIYTNVEGAENDRESFQEALTMQVQELWKDKIMEYIKSCITDMNMNQIIVEESNRDRAIDIYENLNMGGISLNTFDLIMARVAKVYKGDFYDRLITTMKKTNKYDVNLLPDNIRSIAEPVITSNSYRATISTICYNEKNNEINNTYISTFLNVLSLYYVNQEFKYDKIKLDAIKRNAILSIDPNFIDQHCEKVCEAIDKALFFFQTRCGIRTIKELNYDLMLVLVSYIFLNDQWFSDKRCHDALEAWYWSAVFSGEYDSDQNSRLIANLQTMIESLKSKKFEWITKMKENVFAQKNFSTKDFLLLKDSGETGRYPKEVLKKGICQFFLAQTYTDMFSDQLTISVFMEKAEELEVHHVIPLGSTKKIGESTKELRTQKSNILNTPLNFVLITKEDNKTISALPIESYQKKLYPTALSGLCFSGFTDTKSKDDIEKILSVRFDSVKGKVLARINALIGL